MAVILKSDGVTFVEAADAFTTNNPWGRPRPLGVQYP